MGGRGGRGRAVDSPKRGPKRRTLRRMGGGGPASRSSRVRRAASQTCAGGGVRVDPAWKRAPRALTVVEPSGALASSSPTVTSRLRSCGGREARGAGAGEGCGEARLAVRQLHHPHVVRAPAGHGPQPLRVQDGHGAVFTAKVEEGDGGGTTRARRGAHPVEPQQLARRLQRMPVPAPRVREGSAARQPGRARRRSGATSQATPGDGPVDGQTPEDRGSRLCTRHAGSPARPPRARAC